jgi:hypothetical protein
MVIEEQSADSLKGFLKLTDLNPVSVRNFEQRNSKKKRHLCVSVPQLQLASAGGSDSLIANGHLTIDAPVS